MADYINPQQPSTNNQQSSSLPNTDSSMKDQTILTAQVIDSPESLDYTNPNAARLENQTRYASYGKDPSLTFGRKLIWAILIIVGLLLLVSATAFAVFQYIKSNNNNNFVQTNASQGVSIPLEEISNKSRVSLGQASRLDIIGTVSISGTLTLNPSDAPSDPQKGQIYYSQSSNNMYYYNGTQFIEMGGTTNAVSSLNGVTGTILLGSNLSMLGNVLSANVNIPVSVSSIAGITGTVSVGNGLTMSGSTLINSGVVNLSGTTSQITVTNNGNGVYGLSLPQDMSTSSTPTFAGINLSSPLAVSQGGTGSNSFTLNGVLFGNGTSSLQSTASTGPNQCLVTLTVGGIPTWGSCSAGGGVTGSGTTNTIAMFNSSGTIANSLLTQDVGATTVTTTGNANITGTATANAFSGNGASLTNLNGTNITTGTIDDDRLSNNVALLNNTQTLTGAKTFSALLTATNGLSVTGTMVGTSTIQGTQLISTVATGTAPLQVSSTTQVANLNADLLDGYNASDFALASPSGNYVQFAPTTAQTDATTNSSIFINKTGASGNLLQLQNNASDVFSVGNTGQVILKNSSNSGNALRVQRTTADNIFTADTATNRIKIGNDGAASGSDTTLFVVDSATTSNSPTGVNGGIFYNTNTGKLRCYQSGTWANCDGSDISVLLAPATAQTDATNNSSIFINKTGASGNLLQLQNNASDVFSVSNTGQVVFKNTANSTSAFQIQNSLGNNLLTVDTINNRVAVNNSSPLNMFNVGEFTDLRVSLSLGDDATAINYGLAAFNNNLKLIAPEGFRFITGSATGSEILTLGSTNGSAVFKNTTNSTTAFAVQNSTGVSVLNVDTINQRVGVGTNAPTTELEVVGDITSTGTKWTSRTSAADNGWYDIVYGNGLFVAISPDASGQDVMTSPDGVNWKIRNNTPGVSWQSITYGNGLFVAVSADDIADQVMTSPDGIIWTSRPIPEMYSLTDVTYGNGLFVAVAANGTDRVMTSPDGINWTVRTAPVKGWSSVTYGNGIFVAVAVIGTTGNRVMTSADGVVWTSRTSPVDNRWNSVTYGNGQFVAVSSDGTGNRVMTSPDGINWITQTSAANNQWGSVTYGNGLFVAVAYSGTGNRVMTSPDGINWTSRTSAADNGWSSITYGNGIFVAVAWSGTGNRVMTSGKSQITVAPNNNTYQGGLKVYGTNNQFISDANSTNAFSIQSNTGSNVLNIDTINNIAILGQGSSLTGQLAFANSTNNNTISITPTIATANRNILLPDADGTVCLQNSTNCGFTTGTGTAVLLAPATAQTDATNNSSIYINKTSGTGNLLQLQKSGADVLTVNNIGQAVFKNTVDSTSAFQVSNTLGDYLFKVNTDDNNVAVSTDLVVDSEGYNSGTTSYAVRFGSQYSQQAIGSKRSAGGNQNGLDFYTNSINVFNLSNSGSAVFQNSTNSTTALQVKNVAGNTVLNVDTTGNGSVRVPYVGTGNATAFQVSGNGTDIFTVDNNGNRVTVGGINGCSGSPIATSGKLCLNNSSLTGGGAGPYTSQNNTLTVNNTTVATHFANYIRVNDTSAAIGHTNYGLYVDTSTAAGTTNNSATVQGITVNGRSQNAGNLLQLQVAGTNVFNITNTGTALFQNQANSTTALQVKNAGGTNIFTVTTDTATSPGIKVGGWQDFTATTTMDTLLRLNGSTGAIVRSTSGSSVAGIQNQANFDLSQAAGGNLTSLYGMINIPNISVAPSGTLTNAFGEFVRVDNTANAAITNSYALRVGNGSGTGTVNKYGAYIENISGGSSLNYPLYLKSSAAGELFSVNGTGQTIFKNSADSTTALQVQNAAGTDILTVDTTGQNVIVGTCAASPAGQFRVCSAGDAGLTLMADTDNVNESDNPFVYLLQDNGGVRGIFGMVGNAGASPNSNYNFAGTSANAFLVGTETGNDLQFGINGCRGDDGTTGDLIPCNDAITAGGVIATFNGTTGAATFKNVTNSTTAFQVQNVAGNTLLNVDTTTARGFVSVALGNTASTNAVCSSLANATAPTANTAYELRDCNAAPAADYAEMYPVTPGTEYGDIVAVGTEMVNTYDETDGNIDWNKVKGQITRLVKSSSSYQSNVIGIVSNNYGDFTSAGHNIKEQDNPMPVALNGRVPVKISTSSSSIQPGDYITTSPDTGKAIKAEGAGTVIGKALEAWNPLIGKATIMVYVEQGYYPGPPLSTVLQGASLDVTGSATINGNTSIGGSLNVSGNTTLTNLTVNGNATFTGNLTVENISVKNITINGHIITAGNTPTATVGTAAGVEDTNNNIPAPQITIDGNDTAGTVTVVAGANTTSGNFAEVNFNSPFSKVPKVMLNAGDEQTSNLKFYRSAETGRFYIKLSNPPTAGTTYSFDYFIVQ